MKYPSILAGEFATTESGLSKPPCRFAVNTDWPSLAEPVVSWLAGWLAAHCGLMLIMIYKTGAEIITTLSGRAG